MNKRYRIKKQWPGGPKVGTIVVEGLKGLFKVRNGQEGIFDNGVDFVCLAIATTDPDTKDFFEEIITPLFTSEDGVEIFKGDVWHYFTPSDLTRKIRSTSTLNYNGSNPLPVKRYSTLGAAEKAFNEEIRNKVCLSIEDVAKCFVTANNYDPKKPWVNKQAGLLLKLTKDKLGIK